MFVGLTNTPRDYAWGSTTAIAGPSSTRAVRRSGGRVLARHASRLRRVACSWTTPAGDLALRPRRPFRSSEGPCRRDARLAAGAPDARAGARRASRARTHSASRWMPRTATTRTAP